MLHQLFIAVAEEPKVRTVDFVNWLIDGAIAVGMFLLQKKTGEVDAMKAELKHSAEELIKAHLLSHTSPLQTSIETLTGKIDRMENRLDLGNNRFESLGQNDQETAVRIERIVGDFKSFIRENFATKVDLQRHENSVSEKFDRMTDESKEIGKQVAVLTSKAGR